MTALNTDQLREQLKQLQSSIKGLEELKAKSSKFPKIRETPQGLYIPEKMTGKGLTHKLRKQ